MIDPPFIGFADEIKRLSKYAAMRVSIRSCEDKQDRIDLLTENMKKHRWVADILRATLDPLRQYGFTSAASGRVACPMRCNPSLFALLADAANNGGGGQQLQAARWAYLLGRLTEPVVSAANTILNRSPKIKLGVGTINEIFAKLKLNRIPIIAGQTWSEGTIDPKKDWFVCQIPKGDPVLMICRTGKLPLFFNPEGICISPPTKIEWEAVDSFCDDLDCMFDGTIRKGQYLIHDCVPLQEVLSGDFEMKFKDRQTLLKENIKRFDRELFELVPYHKLGDAILEKHHGGKSLRAVRNKPYVAGPSPYVKRIK